jgi:hypothetical protein
MLADAWLALLIASAAAGEAAGEPVGEAVMDMEFLEYLGSWEDSDDEWLMFEDRTPPDEDDNETDDELTEQAPEPDNADAD